MLVLLGVAGWAGLALESAGRDGAWPAGGQAVQASEVLGEAEYVYLASNGNKGLLGEANDVFL